MAGGIKKIHYEKGKIFKEKSIPNQVLTLVANEFVYFNIEWLPETTPKEKQQNITWIWQEGNREVIIKKAVHDSTLLYGIKIPKKLCGYKYYLEASLYGNRNTSLTNYTGLYLIGHCEPSITASKWCVSSDGTAAGKQKQFAYGETVYLNLETHGINGYTNITIEIYAHKTLAPDPLTRTITGVNVTDGEINLEINNTSAWYGKNLFPKQVMEFYVKVKLPNGKYIEDEKGDDIHALFLRIKPEHTPQNTKPPKNTTATKIGKPSENKKNYHPCTLKKIQITDGVDDFFAFQDGITLLQEQRVTSRRVIQTILFDYDVDYIKEEAEKILDTILNFLLYNNFLDIMITGHADDRGSLDYNQDLSEKRANSTKNYLVAKGLKNERIKIQGYGEGRDIVKNAIKEWEHSKNRRSVIEFAYNEYDSSQILYQTLAGTELKKKKITITLQDYDTKQCIRDDNKHQKEIQVKHNNEQAIIPGNQANLKLNSIIQPHFASSYLRYLIQYLTPGLSLQSLYTINFHTCAYFADKTYPSLQIKVYPDLVWIANLQYNFTEKGDYFFHDKKLELETGIQTVVEEFKNSAFGPLIEILPIHNEVSEKVIDYIKEETDKFDYGAHIFHDRDIEKAGEALSLTGKQVNLLTQTKYTKYAAAAAILYLVALGVVIELVLIYLTRGKNLQGKVARIGRKLKELKKFMNAANIEIKPASIAIYGGMYYYQQKDYRVSMVYEVGIKAEPLLEVECTQEFDLVEILKKKHQAVKGEKQVKNSQLKENVKEVLDILHKANILSVKGKVTITGSLACDVKVKYNSLTREYDIIDNLGNFVNTAKQEMVFKEQIRIKIILNSEFQKRMFEFSPFLDTEISATLNIDLNGSAVLKTKFDIGEGVGFYMEKTLFFSGIRGTFNFKASAKNDDLGETWDYTSNDGKPLHFSLIDPYKINLGKIYLFNPK